MSASILALVAAALLLQAAPMASPQHSEQTKPVDLVAAKVGLSPGALLERDLVALTDEAFAERARDAQFILIGEDHRDECDHAVQVRLLDALAKAGLHPVLGMEMVGADQQAALDLFNARRIAAARLDDALTWDQNWNVDFRQYLPLLERAEAWQVPVVALNIPPISRFSWRGRLKSETIHPRWLLPPALPPVPQGDVPMLEEEPE